MFDILSLIEVVISCSNENLILGGGGVNTFALYSCVTEQDSSGSFFWSMIYWPCKIALYSQSVFADFGIRVCCGPMSNHTKREKMA